MNAQRGALLVVSLLVPVVLLAWSPGASVAHISGQACRRYSSVGDADARILARTAQTGVETLATEHNGAYTGISPKTLHALIPSMPINSRQARRSHEGAYLLSASGTANSYVLTTRSQNGDRYTIQRASNGSIERHARACGKMRGW